MKKIFIVLGGIFVALVIIGIIAFGIFAIKGSSLDKECKAYIDEVTPKILSNLSKETLFRYAGDQLKNSAKPEEFEKIFRWFSNLGEFKEYQGSKGQVNVSMTTKSGKVITGYYEAKAGFETGPATIKMITIKKGDDWKIIGFQIYSMALVNK
jgi:hypothetical protein